MSDERFLLPGSEREAHSGERWVGAADSAQQMMVTLLLRATAMAPDPESILSGEYQPESREAAQSSLAASSSDIAAVVDFAQAAGLTVTDVDRSTRRIQLSGSVSQMAKAFGVEVGEAEDANGHRYISYRGHISVPSTLGRIVTAVLGLDQRPVARHAGSDTQ